jgi:hypothetical protein
VRRRPDYTGASRGKGEEENGTSEGRDQPSSDTVYDLRSHSRIYGTGRRFKGNRLPAWSSMANRLLTQRLSGEITQES